MNTEPVVNNGIIELPVTNSDAAFDKVSYRQMDIYVPTR